jgi:hypothetical protein
LRFLVVVLNKVFFDSTNHSRWCPKSFIGKRNLADVDDEVGRGVQEKEGQKVLSTNLGEHLQQLFLLLAQGILFFKRQLISPLSPHNITSIESLRIHFFRASPFKQEFTPTQK